MYKMFFYFYLNFRMHILAVIKDIVRIPFYELDKNFKTILVDKINDQYSNYVYFFNFIL